MRRWQIGLIGSVATAALLAASFPPLKFAFLAPFALTPLLWSLHYQATPKARFLTGWLCGFLYWAAVCYWIGNVLDAYGGLDGPLAVLTLVLFAAAKGLHMAVFSTLAAMVLKRTWAIPAVAALWTGIERTHGPLGFAWLTLGNAGIEMNLPLRVAPFVGVYGISFIFAALACGLALVAARSGGRRQLLWLAPFAGLWLLPPILLQRPPKEQAVSLQPAVPADMNWTRAEKDRMVRQMSLLTLSEALEPSKEKPALVLWPEAPAPLYYYQDEDLRRAATEIARLSEAPFLFAGVAYTPQHEPLNSAFVLDPRGRLVGRYDKQFLVPFGEFIPSGFGWISKISSEAGDYVAGTRSGVFQTGNRTLGLFICYESAFPHLVRETAKSGADVLINLTNDGYFGKSAAREQHLWLARMRAVENRRWLLRSSNDGRTASIDPLGRVWDEQPEFRRLTARLRFDAIHERTLYTQYGDWFAWLCLAAGLAFCVWAWLPVYRPATTIDPS